MAKFSDITIASGSRTRVILTALLFPLVLVAATLGNGPSRNASGAGAVYQGSPFAADHVAGLAAARSKALCVVGAAVSMGLKGGICNTWLCQ